MAFIMWVSFHRYCGSNYRYWAKTISPYTDSFGNNVLILLTEGAWERRG